MSSNNNLIQTLDAFYTHLQSLTPTSPPSAFETLASFFSPDCHTTLLSMREPLLYGREALITDIHSQLQSGLHLDIRRITSQAVNESEKLVVCEMSNRVNVMGQILDPFHETAVVVFGEDGLIESFKVYSCRSPIVFVMQKLEGKGPYSEAEMEAEHGTYNLQGGEGGSCCE